MVWWYENRKLFDVFLLHAFVLLVWCFIKLPNIFCCLFLFQFPFSHNSVGCKKERNNSSKGRSSNRRKKTQHINGQRTDNEFWWILRLLIIWCIFFVFSAYRDTRVKVHLSSSLQIELPETTISSSSQIHFFWYRNSFSASPLLCKCPIHFLFCVVLSCV